MRIALVLIPDEADGGYTVTAPGLPGLVTEGETVDEAMANAREAALLYLEGETAGSLAAAGVRLDALVAEIEVDVPIPAGLLAVAD